jgi:elongation factor P
VKYQTTDIRNGLKIAIDGKPFIVVNFQHVNPGKGSAFVKTKLKNLETGQVLEKTFKSGVDTVDKPDMEEREMEYTYDDMDGYNFMDTKTYESVHLITITLEMLKTISKKASRSIFYILMKDQFQLSFQTLFI